MSLYGRLSRKGRSGFGFASTAEEVTEGLSLSGKTILVTGCNSGLGLETARVLSMRGARVIGTARTEEKARAALAPFGENALGLACELAEPGSVRDCVESVRWLDEPLDAIVCNAGIMAPPRRQLAFGYELQFFTNHIGHFILVTGLLDRLAEDGRVVMLSSGLHVRAPREGIRFDDLAAEKRYDRWTAYGQSKLANLLFAKELARRFAGTKRTANAVHPGVIATNLGRHTGTLGALAYALVDPLFLKSVGEGAATQCYVAVHPDAASISGAYFADCNVARARRDAEDPALARRLWETSERIATEVM